MAQLMRGALIALEGVDGSGKTTLAKGLAQRYGTHAIPTVLTREPGHSALGTIIRGLVQERTVPIHPRAEYLLFAADRAQHWEEVIAPNMHAKRLIISDRLGDSSLVYQGYARGLDLDFITHVNRWALAHHTPDVVIYVRASMATVIDRIHKRKQALSAFEQEEKKFIERVIEGFEVLVAPRPDVIVVDGEQEPDLLAHTTFALLSEQLAHQGILHDYE